MNLKFLLTTLLIGNVFISFAKKAAAKYYIILIENQFAECKQVHIYFL